MKVNGLVCGFCAQGIEKTLRKNPATADVFVSLENRLVAIATKEGQDIPDAELRKALTDAGYDVKAIERTATPIDEIRERVGEDERNDDPHTAQCRARVRRAARELDHAGLLRAAGGARLARRRRGVVGLVTAVPQLDLAERAQGVRLRRRGAVPRGEWTATVARATATLSD